MVVAGRRLFKKSIESREMLERGTEANAMRDGERFGILVKRTMGCMG